MKINLDQLKKRIAGLPKAAVFSAALMAIIVLFAVGRLALGGHGAPAPRPHVTVAPAQITAPAQAKPAAEGFVSPSVTASTGAQSEAATKAPPSAVDLQALKVVLPGVEQPLNLAAQRSTYELVASQRKGYGEYGQPTEIGSATVESRASSFASLPEKALAGSLPTRAKASESWSFWTQVTHAGTHLFVLKLEGQPATASVVIDGQVKPTVAVQGLGNGAATGIGQIDLGTGWHRVTVQVEHIARDNSEAGAVTAGLFLRGPSDSAPKSITPFAVDVSAAPASGGTVASPATASTAAPPTASTTVGGAK